MSFGLRPYNFGSGGRSSGGFTEYAIADAETDNMFTGGLALQEAAGYVTALALTPTGASSVLSTVGVFAGFRYIDATGTPVWSNWYQGNAGNTEAYAYVYDDPTQLFIVQSDGATAQADVGLNTNLVSSTGTATAINQGNTNSGLSTIDFDHSALATTATLSVRLVGIPKDGTNEYSTTPLVVVEFNPAVHQRLRSTGL